MSFAHSAAGTEQALVTICCPLPLRGPGPPFFPPSHPKRNQSPRSQENPTASLLLSSPCALLHRHLLPTQSPSWTHTGNTEALAQAFGASSSWPETQREEQQLVLLIQQISMRPEFQRSLMKNGRWGPGLGRRVNEREGDMKKWGEPGQAAGPWLERGLDLRLKSHVRGFLVRGPGDAFIAPGRSPNARPSGRTSEAWATAAPSSSASGKAQSAGSHTGCKGFFVFTRALEVGIPGYESCSTTYQLGHVTFTVYLL